MMVRSNVLGALALLAAAASPPPAVAADDHGEEARWLVSTSKWATLSWLEGGDDLQSLAMSVASNDEGRIFMYLMEDLTFKASLTFSEAQLEPDQFFGARCGPDGALDPQDPRCAKLTVSGVVSPVPEEDKQVALDALFAAHLQMADWPDDHHFVACEMKLRDDDGIWMISGFGGGGFTSAATYYASSPVRHAQQGFSFGGGGDRRRALAAGQGENAGRELSAACYNPRDHACECRDEKCGDERCGAAGGIWTTECNSDCACDAGDSDGGDAAPQEHAHGDGAGMGGGHGMGNGTGGGHGHGDGTGGGHGDGHGGGHHGDGAPEVAPEERDISFARLPRPEFGSDAAGHARWMVSKSLWTSLSTISSTDAEQPFGNIRSIVDGMCLMASTGLPVFYLPSPDPSSVDIRANPKVSLSFTESALAETLGDDGLPCGGRDAEDPTCAKLSLVGRAVPVEDDAAVEAAKAAFGANHPRAEWLSAGGSHTGGGYYTLELEKITFLRTFGGFAQVSPDEYLNWKPEAADLPGEATCAGAAATSGTSYAATQTQQSVGAAAPSSSSIGFGALFLILLASFAGSFAGGVFKDRLTGTWSRRNAGYSKANDAESPQELTAAVV